MVSVPYCAMMMCLMAIPAVILGYLVRMLDES